MEYQGLKIYIEYPKGSVKKWHDPYTGDEYPSYQSFDYGYIENTLGLDGEEVDVFVGPNPHSTVVFIVTQSKAPDFIEVDEQKVFLGFDTEEQVKDSYKSQYHDPRFFRHLTTMTMDEFADRLAHHRGKLIKSLKNSHLSARIKARSMSIYKSVTSQLEDEQDEDTLMRKKDLPERKPMNKAREKAVDLLKSLTEQPTRADTEPTSGEEVNKALTAAVISPIVRRMRLHDHAAGQANESSMFGTQRVRPAYEPPVVPVRYVDPEPDAPRAVPEEEVIKSCETCYTIHKSTKECPKCAYNRSFMEATHLRFRG